MPTQAPPQIPEVTSGPFSAFLSPPPQQMQVEQAQQQGQQFSGYEGRTGKVAGFLSRFLEGASVGRARADAQALAQRTQKQQNDIDQVNKFIQAAHASGKDPDAVNQMTSEALGMYKGMTVKHLEEAGKSNPVMKLLHGVAQTMLGGPPADERTETDPKTGKKGKVKDVYEGIDHEKMNTLWAGLQSAPSAQEAASKSSQGIMGQAQQVLSGLKDTLQREPTQEEAGRALLQSPVWQAGEQFAQKYGQKNPVGELASTYRPTPTYAEEEKINADKQFREMFGPKPTQGAAGDQLGPPQGETYLPPEALYDQWRKKNIERDTLFVLDKPDGTSGKEVTGYFTPKGYFTEDGHLIPKDRVADKPDRQGGSVWARSEEQDPRYGQVTMLFNNRTGESKIATAKNEYGEDVPLRKYYATTDPQTRRQKLQDKLSDRFFTIENTRDRELTSLEKERDAKDPVTGEAKLTPQQYEARRKAIFDRSKELMDHVNTRGNNLGSMLQNDEDKKFSPIPSKESTLAAANNSPFNLNNGSDYLKFKDPKEGMQAGIDLLDKYMSDKGVMKVNGNSTLLEMMEQWAPAGHGANDPEMYAEAIAKSLNLPNGIATPIKDLRDRKYEVATAMLKGEGSRRFQPLLDEMMGKKTSEPPKSTGAAAGTAGGKPGARTSFDDFMKIGQ